MIPSLRRSRDAPRPARPSPWARSSRSTRPWCKLTSDGAAVAICGSLRCCPWRLPSLREILLVEVGFHGNFFGKGPGVSPTSPPTDTHISCPAGAAVRSCFSWRDPGWSTSTHWFRLRPPSRLGYAQLIAISIALRAAAGPQCWTSPVTAANFIVNDPYLRQRYGFVRYETLVRELGVTHSALTIAFIPYNHCRRNSRTVELLRRHADPFFDRGPWLRSYWWGILQS
jgi:hypothetical protein